MTKPRDPKSPYARKGKRPYQYSEYYQRWNRAVMDHGIMAYETIAADVAFRKAFNVPMEAKRR